MDAYYYASGRRVVLDGDEEYVAVDRNVADRLGLGALVREASVPGSREAGSVVVAQRAALADEALAALRLAGAVQPVYRRDRAVVIPLPEVRVEFDSPDEHRAVLAVLGESGVPPHEVAEETSDRMILRPTSGGGDEALSLANEIYERAHPAAASVRFLQFVPKPAVVTS